MNKLGMCLNWKVLGGLGIVGLGTWVAAPSIAVAALPFLLILVCPISMMLMMRGMEGGQCAINESQRDTARTTGVTADERIVDLRAQQEAIARELAELEAQSSARQDQRQPIVHEAQARVYSGGQNP